MTFRPQNERAVFVAIADKTIANTASETTAVGTGWGSLVLPAGFLKQGTRFHVTAGGVYSTPALFSEVAVKVKLGATVIASTLTSALINPATNKAFNLDVTMTCRATGASGKVIAHGNVHYQSTLGRVFDELDNQGTEVTVDTTASQTMDVTVQWNLATSSRQLKVTSFSVTQVN